MKAPNALTLPLFFLKKHKFLPQFTTDTEVLVIHTGRLCEEAVLFIETFYPSLTAKFTHLSSDAFWTAFDHHKKSRAPSPLQGISVQDQISFLLSRAFSFNASDIHLMPQEKELRLSYRCDGHLRPDRTLSKEVATPLINALKVRANMDISESRRPQTGRFSTVIEGTSFDVRASSHPTLYGESLVLRLLTKTPQHHSLSDLGFPEDQCRLLHAAVQRKAGLIALTGPTGSGKTTTLYSLLQTLDVHQKNVMTLEQPIEYFLPNIRQTEVQENGVMSFANGVRSILRQDPDVILIGEIRDAETAAMAVRAAMTGHLVLTTLHTQNAHSVENRLKELGVSNSYISDLLLLVVAQRLVRTLCSQCMQPQAADLEARRLFSKHGLSTPHTIYTASGCHACYGTGYHGRSVVAEILEESYFKTGETPKTYAALTHAGLRAVEEGTTSLHEATKELDLGSAPPSPFKKEYCA